MPSSELSRRVRAALFRARWQRAADPAQVLRARASRMLSDGLPHSPEALAWASSMTGTPYRGEQRHAPAVQVFALRELSLGAQVAWSDQ